MPTLLQIDFPTTGPFGEEMAEALADVANLIPETPGLRWRVGIESADSGESGGVHLVDDETSARPHLEEHTHRLQGFGITGIRASGFDVNEPLTAVTRGPLT